MGVEPSIPRVAARQMHRNNLALETPIDYYRCSLTNPLLDRLIAEMEFRFTNLSLTASKLLFLVPSILCKQNEVDLTEVLNQYADDLLNPDAVDMEIRNWKRFWSNMSDQELPDSLAEAIKKCDSSRFPNFLVLFKIGCTLPITSCECERSFSIMRRLRSWLRASMMMDRLSNLALMNIHRDVSVDYDNAVKIFMELHPRRILLKNLIFE